MSQRLVSKIYRCILPYLKLVNPPRPYEFLTERQPESDAEWEVVEEELQRSFGGGTRRCPTAVLDVLNTLADRNPEQYACPLVCNLLVGNLLIETNGELRIRVERGCAPGSEGFNKNAVVLVYLNGELAKQPAGQRYRIVEA